MKSTTVSFGFAKSLIDFAVLYGADARQLANTAGVRLNENTDPDTRVSAKKFLEVLENAKHMTGDQALALHWGEAVSMSEISVLGMIMNASETMGEAFEQLQRYARLAADFSSSTARPPFRLANRNDRLFMVQTDEFQNLPPDLIECAFARLTCGPRRFLVEPHVLSVYFVQPAPSYKKEVERVFQCQVHFEAEWNALELHPCVGDWEVQQNPRYIFDLLSKKAELLSEELLNATTFTTKLENELLKSIHVELYSAEIIASKMNMSRQTLFRKLKEENTTYSEVLASFRKGLAIRCLKEQNLSVGETAFITGFSDAASFSRAFKRWTGKPPSAFRKM